MTVTTNTASKIIQNPCSIIGSYKRIVPLMGDTWPSKLGFSALIGVVWLGVLMVYGFLTGFLILWIPWMIVTLSRRHTIHRARLLQAAGQGGYPPTLPPAPPPLPMR